MEANLEITIDSQQMEFRWEFQKRKQEIKKTRSRPRKGSRKKKVFRLKNINKFYFQQLMIVSVICWFDQIEYLKKDVKGFVLICVFHYPFIFSWSLVFLFNLTFLVESLIFFTFLFSFIISHLSSSDLLPYNCLTGRGSHLPQAFNRDPNC